MKKLIEDRDLITLDPEVNEVLRKRGDWWSTLKAWFFGITVGIATTGKYTGIYKFYFIDMTGIRAGDTFITENQMVWSITLTSDTSIIAKTVSPHPLKAFEDMTDVDGHAIVFGKPYSESRQP